MSLKQIHMRKISYYLNGKRSDAHEFFSVQTRLRLLGEKFDVCYYNNIYTLYY